MFAILAFNLNIANSAVIQVKGGCTLQAAIEAANTDNTVGECHSGWGPDIIEIVDGVNIQLTSQLPDITNKIRIEGNGSTIGKSSVFIDDFPIFNVINSSLSLNNLTITGSVDNKIGSAINVKSSELQLTDVKVSNINGGVLFVDGGSVLIENVNFKGNTNEGGANSEVIYIKNADLILKNSIIDSNTSSNGSIFIVKNEGIQNNVNIQVSGTTFSDNLAPKGALYIDFSNTSDATIDINNSNIRGTSESLVGGLYVFDLNNENLQLFVDNSTIENNSTNSELNSFNGGAALVSFSSNYTKALINNTNITNNIGGDCGGLYLYSDASNNMQSTITNSNISKNESNLYAGGGCFSYLNNSTDSYVVMRNTTLSGNNGGDYGGGVYINSTPHTMNPIIVTLEFLLQNATIINNRSLSNGGGISSYNHASQNSSLVVSQSIIAGNTAKYLGDNFYTDNGSNTVIDDYNIFGEFDLSGVVDGFNIISIGKSDIVPSVGLNKIIDGELKKIGV